MARWIMMVRWGKPLHCRFSILVAIIAAHASLAAMSDSSDLIFNDQRVNDYRITFYQSAWDTMLRFNYNRGEEYMPARFAWYGPNGDSIVLDSIGVRYKGNSSYVFAGASHKKPFKCYFNKYRKSQLFFGLEKLNFSNGVQDPSCMREKIAYDVIRKYLPAPRAAFAKLTVEDSLVKSFYTQIEQVDELFLDRHFGNSKYNLYKAADQGATLAYKGVNQSNYEGDYELKTNESENDWSGLLDLVDQLNSTPDSSFVRIVGQCLDFDNCIRYLAFNMVNANFDSYTGSGRNYYLYDNRKAGTFKLVPWDLNLSFGVYKYSWSNVITVDAFAPTNLDQRPLAKRILANDSLKRVYAGYMKDMINGPLCADSVKALAHRYKALIDSCVNDDAKKFYTYEQFVANVDTEVVIMEGITRTILPGLASFTAQRNSILSAQIEMALPVLPRLDRHGAGHDMVLRCESTTSGKSLVIRYGVPVACERVAIELYNASGARVRSVSLGSTSRGMHTATIPAHTVPPGCYALLLRAGNASVTRNILLISNH
ncbi:MAG: CotH kinase family protein [Chitinispirillaceae bacterium]|nr:CotH kinase family protein [Chitinispirillaceae bacterium]